MKIVDEALLESFRKRGRCDVCGRLCDRREPHHLLGKGAGGGGRMDVRENLLSLGATQPFPRCPCHDLCQSRKIALKEQCAIVARREGLSSGQVVLERLWELRRLPKGSKLPELPVGETARGPPS